MNKSAHFCALVCALTPAFGAETQPAAKSEPVRIDVRADRKTGRLVRKVIVDTLPGAAAPAKQDPRITQIIDSAAKQYNLDPLLVHAVVQVESGYNQYAISPVGAEGLMQLMPATARSLGVKNSFDMEENIRAGVKHLKQLQETYKDDRLALAAYNAGAGAVNKYRWIPPYKETQDYVYKVGKRYGEARTAVSKQQSGAKQDSGGRQGAAVSGAPDRSGPLAMANSGKGDLQTAESQTKEVELPTRAVEAYIDAEGRLHMRTK